MKRTLVLGLASLTSALAVTGQRSTLPLVYFPNHGQEHPAVHYAARSAELTAYFLPSEIVFRLRGSVVRMQFPGATGPVRIEPAQQLPGTLNFLRGREEEWRIGLPMYDGIVYRRLYPGIDMRYGSADHRLKSEFVVRPGGDPSSIRVRYSGADELRIDPDGSLVMETAGRELREQPPVVYQKRRGTDIRVEGRFALFGGDVGFILGEYDRSLPLVIDPVITYSTLLGGSGSDAATSLAVDAAGSAYVAGFTASSDFPTANPEQNWNAGGNEVFVAKLNPAGSALVYCTYIGGRTDDRAYGIAVDAAGAAYVAGSTTSANFPLKNALQAKLAGGRNAFVLKLNPAGNGLVYSTYLGGSAADSAYGIALDSTLNAYVAGDSTSVNFPTTGLQRSNAGSLDGFVAKLSPDGARLVYSTYLGGSLDDHVAGIAVDASATAYVTGSTWSVNFPVMGAYQNRIAGGQDAFVARLAANGASLLFSTYLGGSGGNIGSPEAGQGIALDAQGNAYVAGVTGSTDFPVKGAAQSTNHGWQDAFVAKLAPAGTLVYCTYLGGSGIDQANAIAVDATGSAYVVGQTTSVDLPITSAVQSTLGGDWDAFVAEVNSIGDTILELTYLGGSTADTATGIRVDASARIYVAGWTLSTNFPVLNGFQGTNGGNYGAYITKLNLNPAGTPAAMTAPAAGSTLTTTTATFQWSAGSGATEYWLAIGKTAAGATEIFNASTGLATSQTVTGLPADGSTVYARLFSRIAGTWSFFDYTYKAVTLTAAALTSPAPGSTLAGASVTFQWSAGNGATEYWLAVGRAAGGTEIFNASTGLVTSQTVSGLPVDGGTVYVRLQTKLAGVWNVVDYTYKAAAPAPSPAAMTSPAPGSPLTSSSVAFQWTTGIGVAQYWLFVSRIGVGQSDLVNKDEGSATSDSVSALPADGSTLYVRLWSRIDSAWSSLDYTYKAANLVPTPAAMVTPVDGSTLTATTVTLQWNSGIGVTAYWLYVSKVAAGAFELYNTDEGANTSQTLTGLPSDGSTLYVRLWSKIGTSWLSRDYTYKAVNIGSAVPAAMTSPINGSVLAGALVTFQWTTGTGVSEYWLYVSKVTAGSAELFNASTGTNTSQAVGGLPTDGSTVYVRLWSKIGATWGYFDYAYHAAASNLAAMTSPVSGATLPGNTVTFQWSAGAASQYWLYISTVAAGGLELYNVDQGTALSRTLTGLPTGGGTVYVRLWSKIGGAWVFQDYTYKAAP